MRIGLVLSSTPGYSETFFRHKIKGLQSKGHSVVLFCRNRSAEFDLCAVEIFPESHKFFLIQLVNLLLVYASLLPYTKRVLRYIRLERKNGSSFSKILKAIYFNAPVLRQSLDWLHFGFGTLAIGRESLARSIKSKMAVSFRGFDIGVYPVRNPGCYDLLWKEVDKIHVISDDIKALVFEEGFNEQCPVVKITPAIDISYFTDSEFKPISEPVKMVTIARLHWKKGLDYTLKALALLNERGVDFEYTIIGSGLEFEQLKFTSYQLGLQDKVSYKGELKHDEIKSILTDSMLYLQYSVQEGFCNAVLEAQAMGLLCIVSDAEGLSENVIHEQTGWVVEKRNSKLLAERIEAVIDAPVDVQKSISYNAMERVRKEFNVVDQIEAFIKFYE